MKHWPDEHEQRDPHEELLDRLERRLREALPQIRGGDPHIRHLVEGGARGLQASQVAREIAFTSYETLRRRQLQRKLPPVANVLRWIRVLSVAERINAGMDFYGAVASAGWEECLGLPKCAPARAL